MSGQRVRLKPLELEDMSSEQRAALENYFLDGKLFNVFRVFIRNLKLFQRHAPYADYIMRRSALSPRIRELVILRIGWLNRSEYECAHHARMGLEAGLTEQELSRIALGPDAAGWSAAERATLVAVDELKASANLTDECYAALSCHFDEHQLIDLVMTCGNYNMMSTALNVFGVPIEDGVRRFAPFESATA